MDVKEVLEMMKETDVKALRPHRMGGTSSYGIIQNNKQGQSMRLLNSLYEGDVPQNWKKSNNVPIYQYGDKEDPLNYRTVSLTTVIHE